MLLVEVWNTMQLLTQNPALFSACVFRHKLQLKLSWLGITQEGLQMGLTQSKLPVFAQRQRPSDCPVHN